MRGMKMKILITLLLFTFVFFCSRLFALPDNVPELTEECLKDKNAASCWYLGEHEKNSGDMEKAIEWYQKGCNINGSKGCSDLAKYELKNGNKEKAIAIYEKMCLLKPKYKGGTEGYAGCYALGNMASDPKEASVWFQRGCNKRDRNSCEAFENIKKQLNQ